MDKVFAACSQCSAVNRILRSKKDQAMCGKCGQKISLHGLVSNVNTEAFQKIIRASANDLVVVDFWAAWCGPCKMYGPEFEKASLQTAKASFLKIDTEAEAALSAELGIRGIPCTIFFRGGQEIKRQAGAMSSGQLVSLIDSL